jgi:hypothetical protein
MTVTVPIVESPITHPEVEPYSTHLPGGHVSRIDATKLSGRGSENVAWPFSEALRPALGGVG